MKLPYSNILLFFLQLNILVTLYHVNTNNKPYITTHHKPIYISRVLSECDTESSICDKDEDMESVKEIFERQTSQRFEEYQERMKEKRQKRKEQRDKNIQEIIKKDKMEKKLAEKIEKGCLKCGCGLGGVVLPVWGLVSGLWYAALSQHVTKLAIQKGIAEGLEVGLAQVTEIVRNPLAQQLVFEIPRINVADFMAVGNFADGVSLHGIFECISSNINSLVEANKHGLFVQTVKTMAGKSLTQFNESYPTQAAEVTKAVAKGEAAEFAAKTGVLSNTIIASVVTILLIVLVMIIIYLVLRYRRKKKMKKKAHYTKLLNQ
ncbi:rifin [Plasmodium reichenowi]|uniref:Rifin n=1 Tax=Plasmodium reichenowi TaxID=5854 RepID=A0A060RMK5_PLARE|nr:rifin [Plasmodium reichenowi]